MCMDHRTVVMETSESTMLLVSFLKISFDACSLLKTGKNHNSSFFFLTIRVSTVNFNSSIEYFECPL